MRTKAILCFILCLGALTACRGDDTAQTASDTIVSDTADSVGTAGADNNQFANSVLRTAPDLAVEKETLSWNAYYNKKFGVVIKYPINVSEIGEGTWQSEEFTSGDALLHVGFGPSETKAGGYLWYLEIVDGQDVDAVIKALAKHIPDNNVGRKAVLIDGVRATHVTITSKKTPTWLLKAVIIPRDDTMVIISNDAVDLPAFENFYKTFKFVE